MLDLATLLFCVCVCTSSDILLLFAFWYFLNYFTFCDYISHSIVFYFENIPISGMSKMAINHLDKLFVTNDASTIVNKLEVQHLAAKILVLAGKAQQEEIGDGANLTISFAGELLQNAEELIRMGLHPSEIISGYTKASDKVVLFSFSSLFCLLTWSF